MEAQVGNQFLAKQVCPLEAVTKKCSILLLKQAYPTTLSKLQTLQKVHFEFIKAHGRPSANIVTRLERPIPSPKSAQAHLGVNVQNQVNTKKSLKNLVLEILF